MMHVVDIVGYGDGPGYKKIKKNTLPLTSVVTSAEAWAPFWVKCVQGKGREGVDTINRHTCEKLGLVMLMRLYGKESRSRKKYR